MPVNSASSSSRPCGIRPSWASASFSISRPNAHRAPPGTSYFDVVRRKYIQALANRTGRNVILYASKWTQGPVDPEAISITTEDVQGFMEVSHGLTGTALDLVLHLPGGSAEATEAIVNYLRSRFTDIRVFIPQAAMSAASMLACAADRIVMGKHSSIGPIDPQFVMRTDIGVVVAPAHAILEQFALAQKECQTPALLPSWIPILRQYGPSLIIQCKLATQLSQDLVSAWLAKYMFAGKADGAATAATIAAELANHANFKSHGRFISRDQAKGYGLVVEDLETDQTLQDAVLSVFHAATHTFAATNATKVIENHLSKSFIKLQQQFVMQAAMAPVPAPAPAPTPAPVPAPTPP